MIQSANILAGLPNAPGPESFETLVTGDKVLIERIVSRGHRSAEGFWYEQPLDEWVMVIKGEAKLRWETGGSVRLQAGDYLNIPAGCRHRVEWTDPAQETVWLAVHYPVGAGACVENETAAALEGSRPSEIKPT